MVKIRQLGFNTVRSAFVFALNNTQEFIEKIKRRPFESAENQADMMKLMHSRTPIPVVATEPKIRDMLKDPVVRFLMDRDGVKPQTVLGLFPNAQKLVAKAVGERDGLISKQRRDRAISVSKPTHKRGMETEIVRVFVKVEGFGHISGAVGCAVPTHLAPAFSSANWTVVPSSPPWSIVFSPEDTPLPNPGDIVELEIQIPTKKATELLLERSKHKIGQEIRQRSFKLEPALGEFIVSKDGNIVLHHIASLERFYSTPKM